MLEGRGERSLKVVRRRFERSVIVCGGSESLASELSRKVPERGDYLVAADSAVTALRGLGLRPHIIVTDLDGPVEEQVAMNVSGTTVFVHAHGDNQEALRKHIGKFPGPLVGTCQCEPPPGIFNFGGFTDGDRAACICAELGAQDIRLAGFDFEHPRPKPGTDRSVKMKKLKWAKEILGMLEAQGTRIRPY